MMSPVEEVKCLKRKSDIDTDSPKKIKLEDDLPNKYNPDNIKLVSVLRNDNRIKMIILHCQIDDEDAILIFQKTAFPDSVDKLNEAGLVGHSKRQFSAKGILSNEEYHRLIVSAGFEDVNSVSLTVIHPAEEHHFDKYRSFGRVIIQETADLYYNSVVPYLSETPKDLTWVENILNGVSEEGRVLHRENDINTGFTIVLDYKWDEKILSNLHALALVKDSSLTCLRDLRKCHIDMLKNVLASGRKALCDKYADGTEYEPKVKLEQDQIMAYLHYPPTFYKLHVHFIHVNAADDGGTRAGRAHLLDEVIRNLEIDGDFYKNRIMTMYLSHQSKMLKTIKKHIENNS